MVKTLQLMALLCSVTGVSFAQAPTIQSRADLAQLPESTNLCYEFTGGPKVRISREGNILLFQGANNGNHMYSEGYALCDSSGARYSSTYWESGFNPATCTCSGGTTCTVTRTTTDGRMRLTQNFTKKANNPDRTFDISMKVDNLTGSTISNLVLRRVADIDIAAVLNEYHATTRESAMTWGTKAMGIPYAVRLRRILPPGGLVNDAKVTAFNDWSCNPSDQSFSGPVFGDRAITVQFNLGKLNARKSKSVAVQYVRD
jgi:hypothetical protein